MKKIYTLAGLVLPLLLTGCFGESEEPASGTIEGMTVNNRESTLSGRLSHKNEAITVSTGLAKAADSEKTLTMTLVAEIAPPVIDGKTLAATSVVMWANFAFVSYVDPGGNDLGALESIHLKAGENAALRSQVWFDDASIQAVFHDKDIFIAETTSDSSFTSPAVLERITEHGGKFVLQPRTRIALNSAAATSVVVSGDRAFVTTGDSGGLHVASTLGLNPVSFTSLGNARWVDFDDNYVVVVQGMPGRVVVYDKSSLAVVHTWSFTGADVAGKSTVRVIGGKALIAAGSGGVVLMNLSTGKIVGSVPVPVVGVPTAVSIAADARGELIYVSNGTGGVYAVRSSVNLDSVTGDQDIALTVIGKLQFSDVPSVNHVAFDGNTLVVAAGTGGVKIVSVKYQ